MNTKDDTGRTPLHWVAFARKNEIVELLIANNADEMLRIMKVKHHCISQSCKA